MKSIVTEDLRRMSKTGLEFAWSEVGIANEMGYVEGIFKMKQMHNSSPAWKPFFSLQFLNFANFVCC